MPDSMLAASLQGTNGAVLTTAASLSDLVRALYKDPPYWQPLPQNFREILGQGLSIISQPKFCCKFWGHTHTHTHPTSLCNEPRFLTEGLQERQELSLVGKRGRSLRVVLSHPLVNIPALGPGVADALAASSPRQAPRLSCVPSELCVVHGPRLRGSLSWTPTSPSGT